MRRKVLAAVGVILLALSIYNCYEAWQNVHHRQQTTAETAQESDVGVTVGHQAPSFTLESDKGEKVSVDKDDIGRIYVLNFWASWCPPCRAEHPTLTALAAEGIPVMGIDLKDPEPAAQRFLAEHGNPFARLATDPQGRAAIDWGVTAPPETFILDAEGRVLYRHAGPLIREDYTNRFRPELDKALAAQK